MSHTLWLNHFSEYQLIFRQPDQIISFAERKSQKPTADNANNKTDEAKLTTPDSDGAKEAENSNG